MPSFGEAVRAAMRKLHPEFPGIETIKVRPVTAEETAEHLCRLTYGKKERQKWGLMGFNVEFTESGGLTASHRHKPMTPESLAEKLFAWVNDRAASIQARAREQEARIKSTQRVEAAMAEVPIAIGTELVVMPSIDVLGAGELKITGIEDDPTEPVFLISGKLTMAAVKQLLAGTVFTLKKEG